MNTDYYTSIKFKVWKIFKQLTSTACSFTEPKVHKCAEKNKVLEVKIVVLYCSKRVLEVNVLWNRF